MFANLEERKARGYPISYMVPQIGWYVRIRTGAMKRSAGITIAQAVRHPFDHNEVFVYGCSLLKNLFAIADKVVPLRRDDQYRD